MKIGFIGVDLPEGKIKYNDENLLILEEKDQPKKLSPYFAEFMREELVQAEAIVIPKSKILDLLILDIEKVESRLGRTTDNTEKALLAKCMEYLEKEIPLCDSEFSQEEADVLRAGAFYSFKPVVTIEENTDINTIIGLAIEKAGQMFFYTSGPAEAHAWLVKKGSDIVTCAGKIHSDLARGFIKGDVISFDDYIKCHNFNDCRAKGLVRVVDRGYIVQPKEIIEIRFNV